ncbi:glucosamine-6-phosphate deaminase [Domibacillus antri]|uniref:Glucosamine-6-phosphate deaminase n=1 Tax=Domibacillus antri TaxID=1714264 RepID=A0A1Q8Q3L7_9BACI|nr:glucosamine-6-phosphate deaminase [Domibacillus antri]OLN21918.1 glucosamine-6-phosphate deaminase [Domibacillus antri]
MKVIQASDYQEMSQKAAKYVIKNVRRQPDIILGLATGSTPKGLYKQLIADHSQNGTTYEHVSSINLDEYIGLPAHDPNSYHSFMDEQLFQHINIQPHNRHLPNGETDRIEQECMHYEALIDAKGIDLQILGIGENGHIGFNEPGTSFASQTHVTTLSESTRQANARFFDSIHSVPKQAITMGIASIMKSRKILLLASGPKKANAIRRLLDGDIKESFPASILNHHPHVILLADNEALSAAIGKEDNDD